MRLVAPWSNHLSVLWPAENYEPLGMFHTGTITYFRAYCCKGNLLELISRSSWYLSTNISFIPNISLYTTKHVNAFFLKQFVFLQLSSMATDPNLILISRGRSRQSDLTYSSSESRSVMMCGEIRQQGLSRPELPFACEIYMSDAY